MTIYSRVSYTGETPPPPASLAGILRRVEGVEPAWWTLDVPAAVRGRVDLARAGETLEAWRLDHERVVALAPLARCEQMRRIACSAARAEDAPLRQLETLEFRDTSIEHRDLHALREELHRARGLFGEIATPGWEIGEPEGPAIRRDLVLFGSLRLCELGPWSVELHAVEGYVLAHEELGAKPLHGATLGVGEWQLVDLALSCLERVVGGAAALQVREIPAGRVFEPMVANLLGQAELAERRAVDLELRRLGGGFSFDSLMVD